MLIDEITIKAKAGRGGDGVVRWRQEKFIERGGPWGGNGGRGGSVHVKAIRDIGALARYRGISDFAAGRAEDGAKALRTGKNGKDLVLEMPVGAVIKNLTTGQVYRLDTDGEEIEILKGGQGGFGNDHFKSSRNVTPREWTPGKNGEEAEFFIELELAVDAGFIGFPNAGKSSLLNAITNAGAKVGAYAFTTLEPNLGALYGYVLGDIPGLIEGAAEGRGLGHKFLRHIRKTKLIVHCISLEEEDPEKAYIAIRNELEKYDVTTGNEQPLSKKPEIILLTKSDVVDDAKAEKIKSALSKKLNRPIFVASILKENELKVFVDELVKRLRNL